MKIGFDAKRFFNNTAGLGNYSRDLIRILQTYVPQHEYLLYTPKITKPTYESLTDPKSIRMPHHLLDTLFKDLWRTKTIVRDLHQDKVEIFHGLSGEIPMGLASKKIKSVVTIHDLIFMRHPEFYKPIDRSIYRRKFEYACHNADQIVAISEQTKTDLHELLHIPRSRIQVIYQGCHEAFKRTTSVAEQMAIKRRLGLPDQFLLNVGTVEERKNVLAIVKAIVFIDIPLVIVGRATAYREEIVAYAKANHMLHRLFFVEGLSMDDLALLYAAATVFIYPSRYEGFGIPVIEALYAGTPVITTNSGVFPEAGGPFSRYVDPDDIGQLKVAIDQILTDEHQRNKMISEGLQYAQQFNDTILAAKWNDLYTKLHSV